MATGDFPIPNPFAQSYLVHDGDESILHFGAIRIRATGAGNLDFTLYDMDSVTSQTLRSVAMVALTEVEYDRLANFNSQRAMLRVSTNVIDERFEVTRVIIFVKSLWTEFPR